MAKRGPTGDDEQIEHDPTLAPSAADDTLAAGLDSGPAPISVTVRSGGKDDYRELVSIDPHHYVVGAEIARGGMGRILAARDRRLGRPVAIKELLLASGTLRARFEREARITAKLQHPAIVSVLEAGTWPSGEPFYVMKLVTGQSLDREIASRSTLEARLALLPAVIAAVDALAYAHSVRVIHRDLKPGNVLVGEFGETVVIDWGLAKDLADSTDDPDLEVGPYRSTAAGAAETVAGSVIGTPAYMPAEQARGEAVDERADVYALGAMLYHLLVGAPPYTGKTTDLILAAVIAGPPAAIDARVSGAPPDLVTIVRKAMAHDHAGRYPTAKGLADDLKKFQTGQLVGAHRYSSGELLRRWVRRHRTPVVVAAVAAVLLAVLGGVSVRRVMRAQAATEAQRQVAEQSRGEAEDLLSFMLHDLSRKLEPIGKLDVLEAVANKAVQYYQARPEVGSDAAQRTRSVAHKRIADVLVGRGRLGEALAELRTAVQILERLVAKDPANPGWQRELALTRGDLGAVLAQQGDLGSALDEYRAGQVIMQRLLARDPSQGDWQSDLASMGWFAGNVMSRQGDLAGALDEHRASLAIRAEQVARQPADRARRLNLKMSHDSIGAVLQTQGDLAGALDAFGAGLALAEALQAEAPDDTRLQIERSASHEKIGTVLLAQGDVAGALARYRASLVIYERLTSLEPGNETWQNDLSTMQSQVGVALLAQGDFAGALAAQRAALVIAEKLARLDPSNAYWEDNLAISYERVGDVLAAQGDAAGALAEYETTLAVRDRLVRGDPSSTAWQSALAIILDKIGSVLAAQGDAAGAIEKLRVSLVIRERLVSEDPTNMFWRRGLMVTHFMIAEALAGQGDAAGALVEYRASLAIQLPLVAAGAATPEQRSDLSEIHVAMGKALRAQGDPVAALASYRAALPLLEGLAAESPDDVARAGSVADLERTIATCCGR